MNDRTCESELCQNSNSASEVSWLVTSATLRTPSNNTTQWPYRQNKSSTERKSAGNRVTPTVNSRIVRPRDTRAMNMPTNGDHDSHQPQ